MSLILDALRRRPRSTGGAKPARRTDQADTVLATLGYNLAFGERHALDLSWRWVQTAIDQPGSAGADTIRYYVNQLSVAYLVRF